MKKFLSNLLVKYLIKKSTVLANQKIGEDFQLLTIKMAGKKEWIPGQKIQIKVTDKEMRSYTPSKWEADQKTFQTLIYNHRSGPGAQWSEVATPKSKIQVVGPRSSLDIREVENDVLFFGDETTFGLAYALKHSHYTPSIKCFFEVTKPHDSTKALNFLEMDNYALFERVEHEMQLKVCLEKMLEAYADETIVLTGKKTSIDFLEKALINRGISPEKIMKKKYWGWKKPPKDLSV